MALSGTKQGTVTQNSSSLSYHLQWSATQDIKNNESTITVKHYWARSGSATFDSSANRRYGITIDGESFEGQKRMDYSPWPSDTTISTATHTVKHNDDGTKTITISTYANGRAGSYGPSNSSDTSGDCKASVTVELDQIPRAAQLLTASNFTDETNPTITYDNPAGTAADVQVCIADTEGSVQYAKYRSISQTGSSYTFELTDEEKEALIKAIPDGTNNTYVNIYIKTYIDGEIVGTPRSLTRIFTVVNSEPEITYSVSDIGSGSTKLTNNSSAMIKGFNYITASMTPEYKKYATAKSQTITNGSSVVSGTSASFSNAESNKFIFTVKDSFGNEVTKTATLTLIDYVKLTCNITSNSPTADGDLAVKIHGNYFNSKFGDKGVQNTLTVKWRIKENDGAYGNWTVISTTLKGNTYEAILNLTGLNYKSTYTIQATAIDLISTGGVLSPERVTKSYPVFNWGENNFDINVPLTVDDIMCNNIFEGGLESGSYDSSTGAKQANTSNYRNSNYVEVDVNTRYCFKVNNITQRFVVLYYDANKSFISESRSITANGIFGTPNNARYINFRSYQDDYTSDFANLKIEIIKVLPMSLPSGASQIDIFYPIGSVYMSINNVNPNVIFGGVWESISNSIGVYMWKRTA